MISEDQIERFFNKQCSAQEAEQVADWLKVHPEKANKYMAEPDWNEQLQANELPEQVQMEIWNKLSYSIRKKKTILLWQRSAVAACIAGILIIGLLYVGNRTTPSLQSIKFTTPPPLIALQDTEYNSSSKTRLIKLIDGSVISLLPASVVWFDTPFAKKQRKIYLQGEALFEVAKNKALPFTVYAGAFTTTALGTEFMVKQSHNNFYVKLLHGKVVIQTTDNNIKNWKNVYLQPGQQMVYNERNSMAMVSAISTPKTDVIPKHITVHIPPAETADSLLFNGSSIAAVLQKLGTYYHVDIRFAPSDVEGLSFTGVIAKKDSVQNILNVIAQMNGLLVEQSNNSFIISKNKDQQ